MSEQVEILQKRVRSLEHWVMGLGASLLILAIFQILFSIGWLAPASFHDLTVHRLAVVDPKGVERVVIAAPLPEPIILGTRGHRDGPISGILIYDPKGNERGGYVTSDSGDLAAYITLDSERDQVFTAYANAGSGATVWAANERHDIVGFSTHTQPVLEVVENRKVVSKIPASAPDIKQ